MVLAGMLLSMLDIGQGMRAVETLSYVTQCQPRALLSNDVCQTKQSDIRDLVQYCNVVFRSRKKIPHKSLF
jgi:hypothetical protein